MEPNEHTIGTKGCWHQGEGYCFYGAKCNYKIVIPHDCVICGTQAQEFPLGLN